MEGRASSIPKPRPARISRYTWVCRSAKPSENSISSPSRERDRNVVFPAARSAAGTSAFSSERYQRTLARSRLQPARGSLRTQLVDLHLPHRAEDPGQHVEEVDADVGGDPARPLLGALPGHVVPAAARGHVGQVDLVHGSRRLGGDALPQGHDVRVQPELEDVVHAAPGLPLQLGERVQVPRVEHERLLADGVGADPEREADVRVVQVVGRADRHVVDALGLRTCAAASPRTGRSARTPGSSSRRRSSGRGFPPRRAGRAPPAAGCRCPGWPAGGAGRRSRPRR